MSQYICYNSSGPAISAELRSGQFDVKKMAYETITCRMSRSDPSIPWGFTVRSQGNEVQIASINVDSLADKAGLKHGDIVDQVSGRRCTGVADVQREIDGRTMEMSMNLRRFMSHPPALPWSLQEGADNKLHVQGFGSNFDNGNTTAVSASSKSSWENPAYKTNPASENYSTRYETTNSSFSESKNNSGGNAISATPIALPPPSSGPYTYQHHEASKSESKTSSGPGVNPADNYNVSSRSEWSSGNPPAGFDFKNSMSTSGPGSNPADNYNVSSSSNWTNTSGNPPPNFNPNAPFPALTTAPFGSSTTGGFSNQTTRPYDSGFGASGGGFGSGAGSGQGRAPGGQGAPHGGAPYGGSPYIGGGYGGGSGVPGGQGTGSGRRAQFAPDVNYNDQSYIQRGGAGQPSPFQKARSLSPASKLLYHGSPRTRKELSPGASVHHLQYNSPMNLYSTQSAAEQFSQQTGLPVGQYPHSGAPYLSSATRQAIAEEEGARFARGTSPTCSPCFKRISNAVGTPVN
ncbi:unnamed protein product, partial [Mesorhabditis belari]|uniref:PDZ domain-containing protein n=1 Tax=Mesorhabditis belari TaxID=2138241 RepID=A0AAF3F0D4_9BILA